MVYFQHSIGDELQRELEDMGALVAVGEGGQPSLTPAPPCSLFFPSRVQRGVSLI